jgi:hypothetical protein
MFTSIIDTVIFNTAKYTAKSCYLSADVMRSTATYINIGADKADDVGDKLTVIADERAYSLPIDPVTK